MTEIKYYRPRIAVIVLILFPMKYLARILSLGILLFACFASCRKIADPLLNDHSKPGSFIKYTIPQGAHYSDLNPYQEVEYNLLQFIVRFDSTAIYQTVNPGNQYDVNKLYGFSDNNADHHQFSARFGWNWSEGALHLYAYIYNNGERVIQEITQIEMGTEYPCSIGVNGDTYTFTINNISVNLPRSSTTTRAMGYKLYPYFGGDEPAPHNIFIWIREL